MDLPAITVATRRTRTATTTTASLPVITQSAHVAPETTVPLAHSSAPETTEPSAHVATTSSAVPSAHVHNVATTSSTPLYEDLFVDDDYQWPNPNDAAEIEVEKQ